MQKQSYVHDIYGQNPYICSFRNLYLHILSLTSSAANFDASERIQYTNLVHY